MSRICTLCHDHKKNAVDTGNEVENDSIMIVNKENRPKNQIYLKVSIFVLHLKELKYFCIG